MRRLLLFAAFALVCCSPILGQSMTDQFSHRTRGDNSDWWSLGRSAAEPNLEPQKRISADSNFSVLGLALGDLQAGQLAAKLGKAAFVDRGDAATGRVQACYTSATGERKVYLIFEQGEVDSAFYLFSGGPDWQQSDLCRKSALISGRLKTGSGLTLGQTPAQVEAILGKPTSVHRDTLIYYGEAERKTADGSGSYDLTTYIEARFSDGKLHYLGVMKTETE